MKRVLCLLLLSACAALGAELRNGIGLQLWSLRAEAAKDVPAALDRARDFGFTTVELAGTYGLSAARFHDELVAHGLNAVSMHVGADRFEKDLDGIIADAKALGVTYVVIPALAHQKPFTAASARRAARNFNRWGGRLRQAGLKFAYHSHGFEFTPLDDGSGDTAFDILVRRTDPKLVDFEMDVFWVSHAGVDPVALLKKYPDRWKMLHLKDKRAGAPTAIDAKAPATDIVAVGDGTIDWPRVLAAAQEIGVQHYFIEDESVDPLKNIPRSLAYLHALALP